MELLISTPVQAGEVILGKLAPYFLIGLLDTAIIVQAGWWVFGVGVQGSMALLWLYVAVFLLGVLTLGLLISAVTRSQLVSSQIALVATYVPTMLLSGFVFYLPAMPPFIQFLSVLYPARFFVTALRGVYLKAVGLSVLWPQLLLLLLFDGVVLAGAARRFQKKLDAR
jgi:ABC-2 type transport system permease protein